LGIEGGAASLDVPTLLLLGDADYVVPPSEPLRYFMKTPESVWHLQVFHGVWRYPNVQVPPAVAKMPPPAPAPA